MCCTHRSERFEPQVRLLLRRHSSGFDDEGFRPANVHHVGESRCYTVRDDDHGHVSAEAFEVLPSLRFDYGDHGRRAAPKQPFRQTQGSHFEIVSRTVEH